MTFDYEKFNRRYGPWISLGLGVATVTFVRRGARYAPAAVAFLALGWFLAIGVRRFLTRASASQAGEGPEGANDSTPAPLAPSRLRRMLPAAASTASVNLYQNVLFYLVPVWANSATWPSSNMLFPILLGGMALFSCFEYPYRTHILDRPVVLGVFSAVTLFAALVPIFTALLEIPLRWALVSSALAAGVAVASASIPRMRIGLRRAIPAFLGVVGLSLGALVSAGPYLPPVPIVCTESSAGTGVLRRELQGEGKNFPAGTERVYAWFSVASPARWRQPVQFHWFRDGRPSGDPLDHEVTGGREAGFRTWTWRSRPPSGDWRVDLVTDSGQLVGRVRFRVE